LLSNPQFSVKVNYTNLGSQTVTPQLYCVVVYSGVATISGGSLSKSNAVLSSADVLQASLSNAPTVESKGHSDSFYGGNLIESATQFAKDIVKGVKDGIQLGEDIGKDVLPFMGLGGKKHTKKKGGRLVGGMLIDRDELANEY
jgi:hypothetical protein